MVCFVEALVFLALCFVLAFLLSHVVVEVIGLVSALPFPYTCHSYFLDEESSCLIGFNTTLFSIIHLSLTSPSNCWVYGHA